MEIKLKLLKDIQGRTAANLVFNLTELTDVRIIKNNRVFNGKSLLGILVNDLKKNDIITIILENASDKDKTLQAFSELAEVNI